MIIDIHTHLGIVKDVYNMPLCNQLYAMDKYGINYALISDITCGESYSKSATEDLQLKINEKAINLILPHKTKLGIMLWCRANSEGFNKNFENLYLKNKSVVKGLKIHPDIASLPFNSKKYYPYFEMAQKYSLPVLIHTKESKFSKVSFVAETAEKFPKVNFILGHMSLGDSKTESFEIIKKYSNVYGDTAWVDYSDCQKAVNLGLGKKMLFGTDSPIASKDTYNDPYYIPYLKNKQSIENIMYKNAKDLFNL